MVTYSLTYDNLSDFKMSELNYFDKILIEHNQNKIRILT